MKTGRYKVRRGPFGMAILQAEYDFPSFIGGSVDSSVRQFRWIDVKFDDLLHIQCELIGEISPQSR